MLVRLEDIDLSGGLWQDLSDMPSLLRVVTRLGNARPALSALEKASFRGLRAGLPGSGLTSSRRPR